MPGDTKIKRVSQGWIDVDVPTKFYNIRQAARDARRARLQGVVPTSTTLTSSHRPSRSVSRTTTTATVVGFQSNQTGLPTSTLTLTSLQQRLFDRLTGRQGVSVDDAMDVITSNGYNKSASYGHMREAGASHAEAEIVIGLNSPEVSLAYGIARAKGSSHTDALASALKDSNTVDNGN